jgi:hypothetical protein
MTSPGSSGPPLRCAVVVYLVFTLAVVIIPAAFVAAQPAASSAHRIGSAGHRWPANTVVTATPASRRSR